MMFIGASLVCQSDTGFRSSKKGGIPTIHSTFGHYYSNMLIAIMRFKYLQICFHHKGDRESRAPGEALASRRVVFSRHPK